MRFALSGYGWAAAMHADAIGRAGHEVVGVSGPDDGRRDAFAAARRIDVSVRGVTEMLDRARPDALVVCSPNSRHIDDALAAVGAGVHVLVEKPVTVTLAECDELGMRARDAGVTVGVGHMWRHREEVIAFRDRIATGTSGGWCAPTGGACTPAGGPPDGSSTRSWRVAAH